MTRSALLTISFFCLISINAPAAQKHSARVDQTSTSLRIDPQKIVAGARAEVKKQTLYIQEYIVLKYPGGDVPEKTGVCSDLVVRAFRNAGVDLQKELHEDRVAHPAAYPTKIWDRKKADRNIDHRRCQNLVAWFGRFTRKLPIELDKNSIEKNWRAGDVVFFVHERQTYPWHIAIISDRKDADGMRLIIHGYPPFWSETYRLDSLGPIHSHWRMENAPQKGVNGT